MNLVKIYCPKCFTEHEIENVTQDLLCKDCKQAISYESFTCPPYIERDDHGAVISNLGRNGYTVADVRVMGDYTFYLEYIGKLHDWENWRVNERENHLVIRRNGEEKYRFDNFYTTAYCVDEKYVYFDEFTMSGYDRERQGIFRMEYDAYNPEPEYLCDNPGIWYMVSYSNYFVFVIGHHDLLEGKILLMPKDGSWIRMVCTGRKLNIYGNWAYYVSIEPKDKDHYSDSYVLWRISLDGKLAVPMTAISYMDTMTLNANREGIYFNATDNLNPLHRLDHFEKILKNDDLYYDNYKDSAMNVDFPADLLRGSFSDPLVLEDGSIICQNSARVSLATGVVTSET